MVNWLGRGSGDVARQQSPCVEHHSEGLGCHSFVGLVFTLHAEDLGSISRAIKNKAAMSQGGGGGACRRSRGRVHSLSEPRTQTPCRKARCMCDTWLMRLAVS